MYHVSGEVLSFYLARMLGIDAVPTVALLQVNSSSPQWMGHDLKDTQWKQGKVVAMIQWINGLDTER